MIDTADLERWATMDTYKGVYLTMEGLSGLARDYLAMRAIVAALAASDPYETGSSLCTLCLTERGHDPECPWGLAVALIGPVSERTDSNPLEFEGVGGESD